MSCLNKRYLSWLYNFIIFQIVSINFGCWFIKAFIDAYILNVFDFVISILKFFDNEWDYVLIPDCRYPIEVTCMGDEFDTHILRVERPNFESGLTEKQKQHVSETSMDDYIFDAVVYNDSTLDTFKERLINFTDNCFKTCPHKAIHLKREQEAANENV